MCDVCTCQSDPFYRIELCSVNQHLPNVEPIYQGKILQLQTQQETIGRLVFRRQRCKNLYHWKKFTVIFCLSISTLSTPAQYIHM
jgi:hypothetical protein